MNKFNIQDMRVNDPELHSIQDEITYHPTEKWMLKSSDAIDIQDVEGEESSIKFAQGARKSISTICWTCATNRGNRLFHNGAPFRARYISYGVSNISWQAGAGWPVYTSYCPQPNYNASMRFRNAKRHQIVPVFGGSYWIGCHSNASGTGRQTTDVYFWVNDDNYRDNAGTFRVCITGWA